MNNTTKTIIWIVVIALVIWVLSSFRQQTPATGSDSTETGPIKIGVSAPMTGEAASFGEGAKAGADLAVKEINDAGGVAGRMLQLIVEDDHCNKDGVTTFNKLVNLDRVDAVIGSICSAAVGPGAPIAQKAGVPTIIWGSAPNLTKIGDYIFRIYPSDSLQGQFIAEYIYSTLGKKKAAVLYVKNDWGQGLRDVFTSKFKELGGEIVFDEGVTQEVKDVKSQLTKIKAADPDVIYLPAYPALAAISIKQAKDLGVTVPIVGGDAFDTDEIIKLSAAEGVMYSVAVVGNPEDFKTRVKEVTGKESNIVTPLAYDSIKILAKIFGEVGTDKIKVRQAMQDLSYREGVTSSLIEFDEQGDVKAVVFQAPFQVLVVKDGKSAPRI